MDRTQIESWLVGHPASTYADPHRLLDRCEIEIHEHAESIAWRHACLVASNSLHRFERTFGLPASETFVAREVCHELARELRRQAPHLDEFVEAEWLSRASLEAVGLDARSQLRSWLAEIAVQEEQVAWRAIIRFTHRVARRLIAEDHMTNVLEWDLDRGYPRIARRVLALLIREFEQRAERASSIQIQVAAMTH